jgi:DNA mismatch repair protein MutS2
MRDVPAHVRAADGASAPEAADRRTGAPHIVDQPHGSHTTTHVRIAGSDGGVEWARVQALVARVAQTPMGREQALALTPTTNLAAITRALDETAEGRAALALAGAPPWEVIPDVRPTLDAVRVPGAVAEGAELAAMIPLLDAASRLSAYGRGIRDAAPGLADAFAAFPSPRALADLLRRSLAEDGSVVDDASPALRRLRSRLRDLRTQIVRTLERYFQAPGADAIFQERYVTVRHGRYVLPVASSAKSRLRGIVHDRSQSGATLFIEPDGVVDANNELVQAIREEESEVLRVLAALTDAVRAALPELDALLEGMARLDVIFARAELGERMAATRPTVGDERVVSLRRARNPLLLAQREQAPERAVVPVDIELDGARPLLVITGPNAGGKTVTLKTLALLALMAQSGLHVPAADGARLPVFSQVFAIVGDDQSVAENLSTFSAFVKLLCDVLERVDDRSLVVLDELGAGTDPDDGAALAQAVLEELAERGALCIASTHLEPLKGFASTHPRARNASVEFDQERLAPTFRLVYDRPGQSYALAIGARLGLAPRLIERAQSYRSAQQHRMQELLARLDDHDRRAAEQAAAIERREAESTELLRRAEAELESARSTARDTVAQARDDARQVVGDIRRAVNDEWERLRRGAKTRADLEQSRGRIRDAAQRLDRLAGAPAPDVAGAAPPAPGDRVEITHLGLKGEILSIDGGTATVRAGAVTVKVPVQAVRPAAAPPDAAAAGSARSRARASVALPDKASVESELRLIGKTTEEARDLLEEYLDDAFLAGLPSVRIIHGKGTGAVRRAVQDVLSGHPLVVEHRPGSSSEGGAGATVALLGQS